MYISVDQGDTWDACDSPKGSVSDILGLEDGRMLVAYLGGGIHIVSSECSDYYVDTAGLSNRYVTSLTTDGKQLYAGTYQGIYTRSINEKTWHSAELPPGAYSSHVHSILWTPFGLIAGGSEVVFYQRSNTSVWKAIKLDKLTDVISLAWWDRQLVVGTSGQGAYLFSIADSLWTNPSLATGLPLEGIVTMIQQAENSTLISLSTKQGLSSEQSPNSPTQQFGYPRDYVRSGNLEFIAFHETGVFRRGKQSNTLPMGRMNQASLSTASLQSLPIFNGQVRVYPTVVTSRLRIELSETSTTAVPITLLDGSGKIVGQQTMPPGSLEYRFDGLNLPTGMYWCQVALPAGSYVQSFIVR